ncbi:MAG TPA: GNAT family N-acetyltransferase [Stellaceae bacterium]|nr:GNAT family N-acetyltransferase [Stellaceae bacterium]
MNETSVPVTVGVEKLRSFSGTDLEDLCVATEASIEEGGGFGWVKKPPRDLLEKYWRGVVLVPERSLFVGRLDGVVVGSAQLIRHPRNNEAQAFSAQLMSAFVAPWARGHGLARGLVATVEQHARQAGVEILNLDLRETQKAAIQLYESCGYIRWATHPAYAKVAGRIVPGYYYYKRLIAEGAEAPA